MVWNKSEFVNFQYILYMLMNKNLYQDHCELIKKYSVFWHLSHTRRCIYLLRKKKGSVTSSQDSICKVRRYGDLSSLVYTHALNSFIQSWNDFRFHTHLPHEWKTLIQAEGEREEKERERFLRFYNTFILIVLKTSYKPIYSSIFNRAAHFLIIQFITFKTAI